MPKDLTLKRLACLPCTKAKRKCTKQAPSCTRCREKALRCRYPAQRVRPPRRGSVSADAALEADDADNRASHARGEGERRGPEARRISDCAPAAPSTGQPFDPYPWFLTPSSWELGHPPEAIGSLVLVPVGGESFTRFISSLQGWLKQWTTEGWCPLMHRRLYSVELPEPIQTAYTALSTYQARTPATESMVLRIVKERAGDLVRRQPPESDNGLGITMLDTAEHLARTQALVIYSIICLFDSDITARAQAEEAIAVLESWAHELLQSAALDVVCQVNRPLPCQSDDDTGAYENDPLAVRKPSLCAEGSVESTWRAWIFSESIRRVYLVAMLVSRVYKALKAGWTGCPGAISFTGCDGLWDAASPYSWASVLRANGGAMRPVNSHRIMEALTNHRPSHIDEFTQVIASVSVGLGRIERWRAEDGVVAV
ncbi:hypothetical protein ACJ41O_007438 [Fusarium nematophilum]